MYMYVCVLFSSHPGKLSSQTCDKMDRWKRTGGKSHRRGMKKKEDQIRASQK